MNLYKIKILGKLIYVQHEGPLTVDMKELTATATDGTVYRNVDSVKFLSVLNTPVEAEQRDPKQLSLF